MTNLRMAPAIPFAALPVAGFLYTLCWIGGPSPTLALGGQEESIHSNRGDSAVVAPAAGTFPHLQGASLRPGRSLRGPWNVVIDPTGRGDGRLFAGIELGAYWQHELNQSGLELVEYAFSPSTQLQVPGDWNTQDERLFFYRDSIWYQKRFEARPSDGTRTLLHFGAVNYRADVWLNGESLGFHTGGFTPFAFEVTDVLAETNELIVRVNARTDSNSVPTQTTDWLEYGGITRDVRLLEVPPVFVREWSLHLERLPSDRQPARIVGWVQLDGGDSLEVKISVPELGLTQTVRAGADGRAELFFEPQALSLWSPEQPKLYEVNLQTNADSVSDRIGFRTIATRGHEILLNGRPIRLHGISVHEESLLHPGRSHGREDAEATLSLVQELGANFVRLAHYPHDEATTRLADERGLLVWSEIPVYWEVAFGNQSTLAQAQHQLEALIARDRNRASVILWSLANETPQGPERLEFLRHLADRARALDPSRLLTAALLGDVRPILTRLVADIAGGTGQATSDSTFDVVIADPLGDIVDVLGYNEYLGWYYAAFLAKATPLDEASLRRGILERMHRIRFRSDFDKPILISEFGAGARAGMHHDATHNRGHGVPDLWTEEYQALVYEKQLEMLAASPQVQGLSPWILKDFQSALRPLNDIQDWWNRKGLVDPQGRKKLAFEVLRRHYLNLP